jgi:hypothetical protein
MISLQSAAADQIGRTKPMPTVEPVTRASLFSSWEIHRSSGSLVYCVKHRCASKQPLARKTMHRSGRSTD